MRPLTLHASALTDSEYALYTDALLDLAGEDALAAHPHDDSYYAALAVSAREARAWIRGRYTGAAVANGALEPAQVDAVLKLFCPNLAPADTLNGGQFFAALRLVTHLRHGKPLDGSLVFVQGESCFVCFALLFVVPRLWPFPFRQFPLYADESSALRPSILVSSADAVRLIAKSSAKRTLGMKITWTYTLIPTRHGYCAFPPSNFCKAAGSTLRTILQFRAMSVCRAYVLSPHPRTTLATSAERIPP